MHPPSAPGPFTVLMVDELPLLLEAFARLLESLPAVGRVDRAQSPREALRGALRYQYTCVVFRAGGVGDLDGPTLCRELRQVAPGTGIVMLAGDGGRELASGALASGANGVVPLSSQLCELERALVAAAAGSRYVPHETALNLIGPAAAGIPELELSARQKQILRAVAEGLCNREIAGRLCVSYSTVKRELSAVYERLGATSRQTALIAATRRGLLSVGELLG